VEWVVALYDYAAKTVDDLSFQQGDCILITRHLSEEWSFGRLNGREGMFPMSFVEPTAGTKISLCGLIDLMGFFLYSSTKHQCLIEQHCI